MKKNKKIILIFISVITLIIIVTAAVLIIKPNNEKYKKHYKITYSASYNTAKVLENDKQYEIVSDQDRFEEIMDEVKNKEYNEKFDKGFFKNKNLLVVEGEIDPEIKKIKIDETSADITIYYATPLTTQDEIFDFNLYLIPIDKEVEDINVEVSPYPDRVY